MIFLLKCSQKKLLPIKRKGLNNLMSGVRRKLDDPIRKYAKARARKHFEAYDKLTKILMKNGFKKKDAKLLAANLVATIANKEMSAMFHGPSPF